MVISTIIKTNGHLWRGAAYVLSGASVFAGGGGSGLVQRSTKAAKVRLRITKVMYGDDQQALAQLVEALNGIMIAHPLPTRDTGGPS